MKYRPYIYAFVALTALYLWLSINAPVDPKALSQYSLTATQSKLLGLTITIPLAIAWYFALYGFVQLKSYAASVEDSREGKAYRQLADGLMVLAFGLPIGAICSTYLRNLALRQPDLLPVTTITRNYLTLVISLITLSMIARGAESLVKTLHSKPILPHPPHLTTGAIILSSLFTWFIVARPVDPNATNIYYLPAWILVFTLAMPHLYIWYKGALAVHRLYLYRDKVRGAIYKLAFVELAQGIGVVVGLSIFLQFLATLSAQLLQLQLRSLLLVLYVLVGLYAIGYGLVAKGARRLKRIEEV